MARLIPGRYQLGGIPVQGQNFARELRGKVMINRVSYKGSSKFLGIVKAAARMIGVTIIVRKARSGLLWYSVTFDIIGSESQVRRLTDFITDLPKL